MKKEIKITKLIGITLEGKVVGVDSLFRYSDMYGATGFELEAIGAKQYREYKSRRYTKEYLQECYSESEIRERWGCLTKAVRACMFDVKHHSHCEYIGHDVSHICDVDRELKKLGKKELGFEPKTFCCISCGRIFGKNGINGKTKWKVLINPELLERILNYEQTGIDVTSSGNSKI